MFKHRNTQLEKKFTSFRIPNTQKKEACNIAGLFFRNNLIIRGESQFTCCKESWPL